MNRLLAPVLVLLACLDPSRIPPGWSVETPGQGERARAARRGRDGGAGSRGGRRLSDSGESRRGI